MIYVRILTNADTLLIISIVIYSAAQHAYIQWNKSLQRVLEQVTNIWVLLIKICSQGFASFNVVVDVIYLSLLANEIPISVV